MTSFLDGSAVYGSSEELQHELRENTTDGTPGFLMRVSASDLLPRNPEENCIHRPGEFCFLAGEGVASAVDVAVVIFMIIIAFIIIIIIIIIVVVVDVTRKNMLGVDANPAQY